MGRLVGISEDDSDTTDGVDIASKEIDFHYDLTGRLLETNRLFDNTGSLDSRIYTFYGYDPSGRLESISHTRGGGFGEFASYDYQYDNASRITQVDATTRFTFVDLNRKETYAYDQAGRLANWTQEIIDNIPVGDTGIDVSSTQSVNHQLDGSGNRLQATGDNVGEFNELDFGDVYNYTYDDEGNLVKRYVDANDNGTLDTNDTDVTTYTWDHRNRLTNLSHQSTEGGSVDHEVEYRYNTDDLRIRRVVRDDTGTIESVEHYVYEGSQVVAILDGDTTNGDTEVGNGGTMQRRILNGISTDSALVDEVFSGIHAGRTLWSASDHAGSVHDVLTEDTGLLNHFEYNSDGEFVLAIDSVERDLGDSNPGLQFKEHAIDAAFAGREWDADADLYYNRARWYDPSEGRFISQDPIGFAGGDANLYRYTGGDPVNYRDPSGLNEENHHFFEHENSGFGSEGDYYDESGFYTQGELSQSTIESGVDSVKGFFEAIGDIFGGRPDNTSIRTVQTFDSSPRNYSIDTANADLSIIDSIREAQVINNQGMLLAQNANGLTSKNTTNIVSQGEELAELSAALYAITNANPSDPHAKAIALGSTTYGDLSAFKLYTMSGQTKGKAMLGAIYASKNGMPVAAGMMAHYLNNTGTAMNVPILQLVAQDKPSRIELETHIWDAVKFAESNYKELSSGKRAANTQMTSFQTQNNDWHHALGKVNAWSEIDNVKRKGTNYSLKLTFHVRDYYDWDPNSGLGAGPTFWGVQLNVLTDKELHILHRVGEAQYFEINGKQTYDVEWDSRGGGPKWQASP